MLERRQFLRRERRSSVGGETQYVFLHLLVRDVAYGQIPRAQRAEKHRLAAEWIQSLTPDRPRTAPRCWPTTISRPSSSPDRRASTRRLVAPARAALREAGTARWRSTPSAPRSATTAPRSTSSRRGTRVALSPLQAGAGDRADPRSISKRSGKPWPGSSPSAMSRTQPRWRRTSGQRLESWPRDAADEHLDRAFALVADAPLSPAKVRVLAERSRLRMLAGDDEARSRPDRRFFPWRRSWASTTFAPPS